MGLAQSMPTTSPIVSETQTGSLTMKIAGYSQTRGIGVGNSIKSSKFAAGGHSWYISYFPEGSQQETSDWVAVFLHLDTQQQAPHDNVVVTAAFQLSLLDAHCAKFLVFGSSEAGKTFSSFAHGNGNKEFWGCTQFIKRKKLGDPWWCYRRLRGEAFHIRCDVTVLSTHRTPAQPTTMAASAPPLPPPDAVPASDLHRHLGEILSTGDGADVCFMVAGEPVLAHRTVLAARSSVLKDALLGPVETAGASVEVEDMDASVFRAMLHFIYTDALPHIEEVTRAPMAQGLLQAANRFNIERLKLMSEDMLHKGINGETVVSTLMLAEKYGLHGLKKACLMFIKTSPLDELDRRRPE